MNEERPIEKLLRRFAQKRRDEAGAPAQLHPVNRRLLQEEVARQFPRAQRGAGWGARFRWLLNRKLAYATAVVAAVGLGVVLVQRQVPSSEFRVSSSQQQVPGSEGDARRQVATAVDEPPAVKELTETRLPSTVETKMKMDAAKKVEAAAPATFADANMPKDLAGATVPQERADAELAAAAPPNRVTETAVPVTDTLVAAPTLPPITVAPNQASGGTEVSRNRAVVRRQQVTESIARYNEQGGVGGAARSEGVSPAGGDARPHVAVETKVGGYAGGQQVPVLTNAGEQEMFSRRYGAGPRPTSRAVPATSGTATLSATAETRSEGLAKSFDGGAGGDAKALDAYGVAVQNFSQVAVNGASGFKATGTWPVLTNFVVEQSGVQIRMTDSDGSTYTGEVTRVQSSEFGVRSPQGPVPGSQGPVPSSGFRVPSSQHQVPGSEAQVAGEVYFRVSGMNRTLRQPVNFSGNFVTLTNQVATVNATARGMDKNQLMLKQVQPAAQNAVLQNSGIEGRVQVGTQREMQMRAVPVGSKQ